MIMRSAPGALGLLFVVLLAGGCDSGSRSDAEVSGGSVPSVPAAEESGLSVPKAMQAFRDDGSVVEIVIEADDRITFDLDRFRVGPGEMVRLTLNHTGALPAQAMGHNVVIINPDDDVFDFGADVGEHGGGLHDDYVPEALRDRVVAFTPIAGGGQTVVVEFEAPAEAGDYPFLCSFPGHFGQMNGTMEVR